MCTLLDRTEKDVLYSRQPDMLFTWRATEFASLPRLCWVAMVSGIMTQQTLMSHARVRAAGKSLAPSVSSNS